MLSVKLWLYIIFLFHSSNLTLNILIVVLYRFGILKPYIKFLCYRDNIMLAFYLRDLKLPANSSLVIVSLTSKKTVVYNSRSNGISEPVETLFTNKFYIKFNYNKTHMYMAPQFRLHFGPYFSKFLGLRNFYTLYLIDDQLTFYSDIGWFQAMKRLLFII